MSTFQLIAITAIIIWLVLVVVFFRKSTLALVVGLLAIGVFTFAGLAAGWVTWEQLGLGRPVSWLLTALLALAWLLFMLAYSPIADRWAGRWFGEPPHLEAFNAVKGSTGKLITGIALAWLLGGFLEELVARGIVLNSIQAGLEAYLSMLSAMVIAIVISGIGAGLMHLYQGPRAAAIIAQLAFLFGLLFVFSGYNLWAVILCHGMYDTIAFIRFATGRSRYARAEQHIEAQ